MSTTAICGCELLDANGNPAINAAKAIAFETNLIQEQGYWGLIDVDRMLDPMIPVRPANPNEGETPRDYIEYSFALTNTDIAANDDPFSNGTVTRDITIDTPTGQQTFNDVVQLSSGSPICDNRSVELAAGQDVRRGVKRLLPDINSPCICLADFYRVSEFARYLGMLREAMPAEMATMKERVLLRDLVSLSEYNASEVGSEAPIFTAGAFPHLPTAGPNIATFRRLRDRMQRLGHGNRPIQVPISGPALQAMMINWYQTSGIYHVAMDWASGNFPESWTTQGRWTFENIEFVLHATPIKGYFVKTTTGQYQFVPISPRKFRKGTGAGLVVEYNEDYDKTQITIGGATYEVFELSPVISDKAFYQQPYGMNAISVGASETGQVRQDATMWNGVQVRVIGGAFIPCNEKLQKFKFQLSNYFKLVPKLPRLSSFVAFRTADYIRSANLLGVNTRYQGPATESIIIGPGTQPNASSCADARAGLYPQLPAPGPQTSACGDGSNSAGKFRTQCALVVAEDASSLVVTVERIDGYEGAASIAYATANGTATSGTDYTAKSGTLSWADGEFGAKSFSIPILAGARNNYAFTVGYSSITGATLVTNGCTSTAITITRPAHTYTLAAGLTGSIVSMVVDGGAFPLPNQPYAASTAGADALQDDINEQLNGDGYANVVWTGSAWSIVVSDTHKVFNSATNNSATTKTFAQS